MDERAALALVADVVPDTGDDAAVVDDLAVTTDMLHERTDLPDGVTPYTVGWRSVAVSLSDLAATGARAVAAVAAYGAPAFEADALGGFFDGATDVCERVGARYVGGDLDAHDELTVATTAVGRLDGTAALTRSGVTPGERLCVTGELGRTAAALGLFERADGERSADESRDQDRRRANELFRFTPRVATGRAIAEHATAALDVSDGLARSAHMLAAASGCGVTVDGDRLPVHSAVDEVVAGAADRCEAATFVGEDFELLFAVPDERLSAVREASPVAVTELGRVTETGVTMDGEPLPDRGYTHGADGDGSS
ncbi:thiamine-phosphate kinase [Halobacteriales archaeon SW_5_70_135]|nr:MAG: thiamine-phosphate kinase [Halobacteriales archaeon SW_5_70_135]